MLATFCQLFLHGFQTDIRRTEYQSLFEAFEIDNDANEDSTLIWICLCKCDYAFCQIFKDKVVG